MIQRFQKNIRLFFLYSRFTLKTTFQARLGILFFILGKLFRFVFLLAFIFLIFGRTKAVQGYTLYQAIVFYLTFNIIDTLTQVLFREVYRFRPQVVSGAFDMVLLKPMHPFTKILFGGIDFMDIFFAVPYTLLAVVFFLLSLSSFSFLSVFSALLLYLILILNSLLLATAFHIIVLALGIITTEVDHTIMIYRDLTGLGRFPMEIYKEPLRSFFTFAIPVGIMMTFPSKALFGLLSWSNIWYAVMISAGAFIGSLYLWKLALRKYQSWGG